MKERLGAVLYNLTECVRLLAVMLSPALPQTAAKIREQLRLVEADIAWDAAAFGARDAYAVGTPEPLFSRIDIEKQLAAIQAEKEAEKAVEEKAENVAFLSEISIEDFAKVDLRVARITACEPIKKAKKLLRLTLDDGSGKPRTVASGIALYYTPEELVNKNIVVIANLKPAVLCGVESQGMILATDATNEKGEPSVKVLFVDGVAPGSKIR